MVAIGKTKTLSSRPHKVGYLDEQDTNDTTGIGSLVIAE